MRSVGGVRGVGGGGARVSIVSIFFGMPCVGMGCRVNYFDFGGTCSLCYIACYLNFVGYGRSVVLGKIAYKIKMVHARVHRRKTKVKLGCGINCSDRICIEKKIIQNG